MTPKIAEGIAISVPTLIETRLLIQANSGAGKSWALRRILEQTAQTVQQIVIDPEGEFSTLREKHDYIICAAHDGDAQAHPKTAKVLARKLLETGASAIIDIYDLKAHERQSFVRLFFESLINAPKKLWRPVLIALDEAHVFAPEKGKAESAGAVIDIATRGRKRGLGLILATQRLSKLHKDAAAEMINKMIGRTSLDIDVKRAVDELGMNSKETARDLRSLAPGEFYIFGPALSSDVTKATVGPVKTKHPKVGERLLSAPPKPSAKILRILSKLKDIPQEAEKEAKTLAEIKAENAKLKRELRIAESKSSSERAVAQKEIVHRENPRAIKALRKIAGLAAQALEDVPSAIAIAKTPKPRADAPAVASIEGLRSGAIRILQELAARYPAGYTKAQVGALTRFSHKGGTFGAYFGDIKRAGYLEVADGLIYATHAGLKALGDKIPSTPTSHAEAMALWAKALRAGAYRILETIVGAGPDGITREKISEQIGMAYTGGTFGAYIGDLTRNGLVNKDGDRLIANDILFPKG